jgi:hypothetical protein
MINWNTYILILFALEKKYNKNINILIKGELCNEKYLKLKKIMIMNFLISLELKTYFQLWKRNFTFSSMSSGALLSITPSDITNNMGITLSCHLGWYPYSGEDLDIGPYLPTYLPTYHNSTWCQLQ